jgi:hypothetical protein
MTSELKSATSRANGAKSHGPITPEGKEISSQNALTHGFTSKKTIVLKCENDGEFQEMLGFYAETYQPGSPVERDLVHEMVACRWRMERIRLIETQLIDSEMDRELPEGETPEDPGYQLAFAFRRLVDESRAISLASRYESRLHRIHERTHRTLHELQQSRLAVTTHGPSVSVEAPESAPAPIQPEPPPPTVAVPEQAPPPTIQNCEANPRPRPRQPPGKTVNAFPSLDIAPSVVSMSRDFDASGSSRPHDKR